VKEKTKEIALFLPYLPYARQDRENKKGEALSADVLCGILKNYGVKKLITYDCHFLAQAGNFTRKGLNIENISASRQLYAYAKKYFGKQDFCVIAPDKGSSCFIANAKGGNGHSLEKTRGKTKANGLKNGIHGDVNGMTGHADLGNSIRGKGICILDDIISTGGTLVHAIQHLKSLGAKKIIVGATHGVFAGDKIAEKILKSGASKIFVTSAILNNSKKVEILKL
jgi:ribose-phosphate pyrophosphokinase